MASGLAALFEQEANAISLEAEATTKFSDSLYPLLVG
jgi:hypothetical protein